MNEIIEETLKARILVVDDNPTNVVLLERILAGEGYTNVSSTTDPCTVQKLHQDNPFDLILLDIRMPQMDGFQVMEQLADVQKER